jgi:hypothetical protein
MWGSSTLSPISITGKGILAKSYSTLPELKRSKADGRKPKKLVIGKIIMDPTISF